MTEEIGTVAAGLPAACRSAADQLEHVRICGLSRTRKGVSASTLSSGWYRTYRTPCAIYSPADHRTMHVSSIGRCPGWDVNPEH